MTEYRLVTQPRAEVDVRSAYEWYERERTGLGDEFVDALRAVYDRVREQPLMYQELRAGIRRALMHRFPYGVYFAVEGDVVVIVAILHTSRDPAEWEQRRG